MKEIFLTYPIAAWSVVSVMVAGLVTMLMWQKMKWWWHNTWDSFPLVGRIASLSGDLSPAEPGWFKCERTLCSGYKKFIRIQDEYDFNEKISYIRKSGDTGRKDTPKWIWLLTISLVFVEAMGFSYVLAGFTIPGASENTQQYGALGIAFMLSVILVAFTHFSGHELYVASKVKQARQEWAEDDSTQSNGEKHKFRTGEVEFDKPQSTDDGLPAYTQLANRVGTHPGNKITAATIALVVLVAIGATYVRGTVLEQQLLLETTGQTTDPGLQINAGADGLDMASTSSDATQLPSADVAEQNKVEEKARLEGESNKRGGGWGTFIVLAFVFVFLQILGVIFGFKWGFAGKKSADAYKDIGRGRYSSYADVREHYQEISDTAQEKLESLQQKLMAKLVKQGNSKKVAGKTFRNYMEEERANKTKHRINEREHAVNRSEVEAASIIRVKSEAEQPIVQPVVITQGSQTLTVDTVLAQINELGDAQAKRDYMSTLPSDLCSQVATAIRERKAVAEKAKSAAELDGLFD